LSTKANKKKKNKKKNIFQGILYEFIKFNTAKNLGCKVLPQCAKKLSVLCIDIAIQHVKSKFYNEVKDFVIRQTNIYVFPMFNGMYIIFVRSFLWSYSFLYIL